MMVWWINHGAIRTEQSYHMQHSEGGVTWEELRDEHECKAIKCLPHLHAEVSLDKMLNPELPLIEQQSAANRCTVWMCVWM